MIKHVLIMGILLAMGATITAVPTQTENLLFDSQTQGLADLIIDLDRRQAIYSYIIANASTPEIDLVALLPPDDRAAFLSRVPEDADKNSLVLEFVMAKMSTRHQSAGIGFLKKKMEILRQVISKGQK